MITNLRDLCDFFGADTPAGLNRRIYKDTDCGASISICLGPGPAARDYHERLSDGPMEEDWVHNGDPRWRNLTGEEHLHGFTIQTIVEGSEATVDSDVFVLPVPEKAVEDWLKYMEDEAHELWLEANEWEDA